MNKITEEGKSIRQIVPADFVFLSQADGQVLEALEGVLKLLFGYGGVYPPSRVASYLAQDAATVVNGVDVSYGTRNGVGHATLRSGVVLYQGRLWDLEEGASWEYDPVINHGLDNSFTEHALVFEERTVAPSPVYGASDAETVSPHVKLTCRIALESELGTDVKKVNLAYVFRIPYLTDFNTVRRLWEFSYNHTSNPVSGH